MKRSRFTDEQIAYALRLAESGTPVVHLSYVRRDQAETSVLFELISERYERKSLAITANTPFSQWGEVFV